MRNGGGWWAAAAAALVVLRLVCAMQSAPMSREPRYTRVVTLKQGNVQGRVVRPKRNALVADVEVYLGVPYAAPPVGNLRFMPPGEPPQWPDTLQAVRAKPVCPQMPPRAQPGGRQRASAERDAFVRRMRHYLRNESEDCLYLNIYVPHPQRREYGAENRKYPVILFVHGESFEWNSGNLYDGSVVAGFGNVIFITINFRLGIFGFLKQGLTVGRANFGLSDQIAALQWTKRNVGEFGGDAGKITVMGHGTGAACVNFLMLSPVAEGLFHRAIVTSGSALSPWALTATPLHYIQLQDEFNCSSDDVVDCLQRKRKEDIVSAFEPYELLPFENFTPVVDEIVVLNSPADQMDKYTLFSKYDLLAGITEVESYFLLEEEFLKLGMLTHEGHDYLDKYAKAVFKKTPDKALMKMIEHYLGHLRDNSPIVTRNAVLDALSDLLVTAPLLQTVRYHAATPKNTFFYVFGHRTVSEHGIKTNRSVYGDDLPYFLGVPIDGPSYHYQSEYTSQEEQLSEAMLKYFTNFAKTGNPYSSTSSEFGYNGYNVNRLSNTRWPPYNLDKQSYMYFGATTQIRHHYRQESDSFWNREMPRSMKQSSEESASPSAMDDVNDVVENDDTRSPPVYGLPPGPAADAAGHADNNFLNGVVGWPPDAAAARDELASAPPSAATPVPAASFSSLTATALVVAALLFLLANVLAFAFMFYQRGKLRVRENLFRNRFRCKTVSVPDLFDETEGGDIYAAAATAATAAVNKTKKRAGGGSWSKRRPAGGSGGVDSLGGRVASVKPEAMSGKRMRRWPLSRQCSGSTITVDAHSKVRDWIVTATPRFARKCVAKKKADAATAAAAATAITADHEAGAIEMRTIERRPQPPSAATGGAATAVPSSLLSSSSSSSPPHKISVAIDATPATRTNVDTVLATELPVAATAISKECRGPPFVWRGRAVGGGGGDYDGGFGDREWRNAVGTHKSSAHIRLKTPQFLLETTTSPSSVWHSHSRSDPSPVDTRPTADALYSRVDKSQKKRLESFAGSCHSDGEEKPEREREREMATSCSRHYEEINVTSRPDTDADADHAATPSPQQTLRNLVRRNFPKVLPDMALVEQKRAYRSSLPAGGADDRYVKISAARGVRVPPAPPPRITSTLGRRQPPGPASAAVAAAAEDEDGDGSQLSRITVRLQHQQQQQQNKNVEPPVAEEWAADLIQTESCHPSRPPPPPLPVSLFSSPGAHPAATAGRQIAQKKSKEVRSVTTSTTGIS